MCVTHHRAHHWAAKEIRVGDSRTRDSTDAFEQNFPRQRPVEEGQSAPTSALPLATAARNLRLSFSPTDRSVAPSPQVSFPLTSLWTRWAEARPHQRRASGMPVPRGIGSRCTEARVEWQPRLVRERGDLCTNTRKRPIFGKASSGADRNSVGRPMLVRRGASFSSSKEWRSSDTDDKNKSVCLFSRLVG